MAAAARTVTVEGGEDHGGVDNVNDQSVSATVQRTQNEDAKVRGGSIPASIFGIVKAMVGPAILYLPHSFADAGYAFSLIALAGALVMYLYSSNCLLESWRAVTESSSQRKDGVIVTTETGGIELMSLLKRSKSRVSDTDSDSEGVNMNLGMSLESSDDAAEIEKGPPPVLKQKAESSTSSSITYPQLAKIAYGDKGEGMVRVGITLMQLGVCLTYFIFVPHNLSTSIKALWHVDISMSLCLFGMVLLEIPLSCIKDIRRLTYTNVIANFLILFGLLSCLWHALGGQSLEAETQTQTMAAKMSNLDPLNERWYLFVGTSVLLFEGSITLCIPLQEAVQGKEARLRFPSVYRRTISSIVAFYSFFGIVCWSAFGNDVNTVLTTSLPEGVLTTSVQLAYSLAVIFTFPLQIYPAIDIIMQSAKRTVSPSKELSMVARCFVVTTVISSLSIIAVVEMENLGRVVSLMGSLLGCPLAFVFPPLIHNRIVADRPRIKFTNSLVAGFGIFAMVGATFSTLATWKDGGEGRRYFLMR